MGMQFVRTYGQLKLFDLPHGRHTRSVRAADYGMRKIKHEQWMNFGGFMVVRNLLRRSRINNFKLYKILGDITDVVY